MAGQNHPQLPETVPYSQQRECAVGEEHVARRMFRYTIDGINQFPNQLTKINGFW